MVLDSELNHKAHKEKTQEKKTEITEVVEDKIERIEDFVEDIKDDGKRNYSHDPKRKSPGRKKKFLRKKR